jgi:flavodoxin
MRKLIVYYSFDGNTAFISRTIAAAIGADMLELKLAEQTATQNFTRYFWCGRLCYSKQNPELLAFDKQPGDYDLVFIGTPVWEFTFAPPLKTFFSKVILTDKKVALFCCHGGGRGKTFEKMEAQLPGNKIVGKIDFVQPLKFHKKDQEEKAQKWAKEIITSLR